MSFVKTGAVKATATLYLLYCATFSRILSECTKFGTGCVNINLLTVSLVKIGSEDAVRFEGHK
jgi:hypothetical protein